MLKLGTMVKDTATQLVGMLTHLQREMNGNEYYLFQPRGLSPETGQPVKTIWLAVDRIEGGTVLPSTEEPDLHLEVLGTEVEDEASGFKGIAVHLQLHINGCVHFFVQPSGTLAKTNGPIATDNFDIRRLKGAAIKPLSPVDKRESERRYPSPVECGSRMD